MMISTRGRYALRVMTDLAEHPDAGYIPLRQIAQRQDISEKYLESILKALVHGGLLEGVRGKGGGYRLTRPAEQVTVGNILRLTEDSLAPVACLDAGAAPCPRAAACRTRLDTLINDFFDGVALADLIAPAVGGDYII